MEGSKTVNNSSRATTQSLKSFPKQSAPLQLHVSTRYTHNAGGFGDIWGIMGKAAAVAGTDSVGLLVA